MGQKVRKWAGSRGGFTLLELLVVLAIIGLLTAILMPTLKMAKGRGRQVVCRSNLHQWGIAFAAYTDGNNERFFLGPTQSNWDDWVEIMEPYIEMRGKINCCPLATRTVAEGGQGIFAAWADEEGDFGSYGVNAWICDSGTDTLVFKHEAYWGRADVPAGGNIPVLLDAMYTAEWPDDSSVPPDADGDKPQSATLVEQMKKCCIDRHGNATVSCLFVDHSVRPVGLKELWTLKWHRDFNTGGHWTTAGGITAADWPAWMRDFRAY